MVYHGVAVEPSACNHLVAACMVNESLSGSSYRYSCICIAIRGISI